MALGLSRDQAIAVIDRQKFHEALEARAVKIRNIADSAKPGESIPDLIKAAFADATRAELATKPTPTK